MRGTKTVKNRLAAITLLTLLCAACGSDPNRPQPKASDLTPFSQRLAYCEAVSLYLAEFLRDQDNKVAARIAVERWSRLLTANAFLNAEDGEGTRDMYRRFEDASKGQREVWSADPQRAIADDEACDPLVEEGWKQAEASETDEVDGKTMEEWRKDVYRMALPRLGL